MTDDPHHPTIKAKDDTKGPDRASSPPERRQRLEPKRALSDAANQWLAKNRSLVLRQTPVWAQALTGVIVAIGTLGVLGSVLFKIDEVVTVQGQLQSIGGSVEVKTPAGGQVEQVFFKDGDRVKKGQLLLRFDTREAAKEAATLTNMIALEQSELASRQATLISREEVLASRKEVLKQRLRTAQSSVAELSELVRTGGFQRLQYLEKKDQVLDLQQQVSEIDEQTSQIRLQADQTRLDSEKNIGDMRNRLVKANLQLQYQNVLAPVDGVVFDPKALPKGVLGAGDRILTLIPLAGLYGRVYVPNKDIGFVKPGQTAKVRVDAFPFQRYGELNARVEQVGADALPPDETSNIYRFPVRLKLERPYLESQGERIPLQNGMAITTNLKLREKRVISLLSDLLVNQVDSVRSLRQQ